MEIFSVLKPLATQLLQRGDLTQNEQEMLKKALLLLESAFTDLAHIEDPRRRDAIKQAVLGGIIIGRLPPLRITTYFATS